MTEVYTLQTASILSRREEGRPVLTGSVPSCSPDKCSRGRVDWNWPASVTITGRTPKRFAGMDALPAKWQGRHLSRSTVNKTHTRLDLWVL